MARGAWAKVVRSLSWVLLLALPAAARAGESVRVELLEGPIKDLAWDLSNAHVTESYAEPAFGFVAVPPKYSDRGMLIDRSSPFVVRATRSLALPAGEYQLLLRSRNAARLYLDDKLLLDNPFPKAPVDGHNPVPEVPDLGPDLRPIQPGQQEKRAAVQLDGGRHSVRLEFVVGGRKLRPELGEPAVAIAAAGQPFRLLADPPTVPFSDAGWEAYRGERLAHYRAASAAARKAASAAEDHYWRRRHDLARQTWAGRAVPVPPLPAGLPGHNAIDHFLGQRLAAEGVAPAPLADDDTFLRRVTLDTVGVIPSPEEIAAFRADPSPDRRARVIDRLLGDDRWADHWTSYWQDVLAENPGLVKPTLNNTGPFRFWIHRALADNLAADRFATELIRMEGSFLAGEPAGFALATENDVPTAAKGQVIAKAFLAADLTCARCHDAPSRIPYKQEQLFSLAAMLERNPIKLPATSTVPKVDGTRQPAVRTSLKPGTAVAPAWHLDDLASGDVPAELLLDPADPRERVAAILTAPADERFAQVLANRVWKRYFGVGLVEPVDNWLGAKPSHPELLTWLGRELLTRAYDLKHVARLILSSHAYQRTVAPPARTRGGQEEPQLFAGPARRRLTAEQLVDSLFAAAGKAIDCEALTLDPDGRQEGKKFLNLGVPRRAWEFADVASERDRPALALPLAQAVVDLMVAYGWRDARPASLTERDHTPTPLQSPGLLNGLVHRRAARLSDDSAFTALCLEDRPLPDLIDRVFERVLTRRPTAEERVLFEDLLFEGYSNRRTGGPPAAKPKRVTPVSWSNHLHPDATRLKLALEELARAGDPPAPRLRADWRQRMEDALWALFGTPEFVFVP
jgi:hypothetical protein